MAYSVADSTWTIPLAWEGHVRYFTIALIVVALLLGCVPRSQNIPGEDNATKKPKDAVIVNDIIRNSTRTP